MRKIFLLVLIGSLVISAFIGILIFILGDFGDGDFGQAQIKLLLTTLTLAGFSLTSVGGLTLEQRGKFRFVSYASVLVSTLGFVLFITGIWAEIENDGFWRAAAAVAIVAVSLAHTSLLLLVDAKTRLVKYTLTSTLVAIASLAVVLICMVTLDLDESGFFRLLGVLAILDVLGSLSTPLIRKVVVPGR